MPLTSRPQHATLQIDVLWGDALLACEVAPAPVRVATVVARAGALALPAELADIVARVDTHGALTLGSEAGGWHRGDDHGEVQLHAGSLTVRAKPVQLEAPPGNARRPGILTALVVGFALLHVGAAIALLRRADTPGVGPDDTGRDRMLRALIERVRQHAPPPSPQSPVAPQTHGGPGAAAPIDDTALAELRATAWESRRAHRTNAPPAPTDTNPVARRGVFAALTLWDPRTRRAAESSLRVFATMGREPVRPPHDLEHPEAYPGMGRVSIGAGRGCRPPEDCGLVLNGALRLGTDHARAARVVRQPLAARAAAPPETRAAPPDFGEMTMDDVRRIVRHDVLADVVRCYSQRAEAGPIASGRVVVRFGIRTDGRVTDASVVSSAINDAPTHACIATVLRQFTFPASNNGAQVTYPFVFSSFAPES